MPCKYLIVLQYIRQIISYYLEFYLAITELHFFACQRNRCLKFEQLVFKYQYLLLRLQILYEYISKDKKHNTILFYGLIFPVIHFSEIRRFCQIKCRRLGTQRCLKTFSFTIVMLNLYMFSFLNDAKLLIYKTGKQQSKSTIKITTGLILRP